MSEERRKIWVFPRPGGFPRMATVTGRTITGKLKAVDQHGNRYKVDMRELHD